MNCYILIGGRSSRMKRSKSTLDVRGETFLERTHRVCSAVFSTVVAVDRNGAPVDPSIPTLLEEAHQGQAAMFGIAAALRHAPSQKIWVVAVDYPGLSVEILEFLRDRFEASRKEIFVPQWNQQPQMLCAGYDRRLLPLLEERLERGDYQLRELVALTESEIVPERELRGRFAGEPLTNVNTPTDLEAFRRGHAFAEG